MSEEAERKAPGRVRDAIVDVLSKEPKGLSVRQIEERVNNVLGATSGSSIRSYLRLNSQSLFLREDRGLYRLRNDTACAQRQITGLYPRRAPFMYGDTSLFHGDCFEWLEQRPDQSIHAVLTDPPYGLHEYSHEQQMKLRNGKGGVWRIPPAFDGHKRSPLPRFTTLTKSQIQDLRLFFLMWGRVLIPKLVPGANVIVASNPLLSYVVANSLCESGLERRGEIIRLVMTMRGGDRPKAAHEEFSGVTVMPRSMWEPWLVFRKPIEGRVQDNLRKWKTGGFRRPEKNKPFGDVVLSKPTQKNERSLAQHPSLKPQAFLRQLVWSILPLGEGTVLDPFAGSGSTLAAAEAVGYTSIGIEKDEFYFDMASRSIPKLAAFGCQSR